MNLENASFAKFVSGHQLGGLHVMWGQASNRWTAARDRFFNTKLKNNDFRVLQKRNYGKLKMVGIFRHLRWSGGVRVPVAYIILSTILTWWLIWAV